MNWNWLQPEPSPKVLTPCIGVCTMGEDDLCMGCLRSGAEIAAWGGMSDAERQQWMDQVLPARAGWRS